MEDFVNNAEEEGYHLRVFFRPQKVTGCVRGEGSEYDYFEQVYPGLACASEQSFRSVEEILSYVK